MYRLESHNKLADDENELILNFAPYEYPLFRKKYTTLALFITFIYMTDLSDCVYTLCS